LSEEEIKAALAYLDGEDNWEKDSVAVVLAKLLGDWNPALMMRMPTPRRHDRGQNNRRC